MKSSGICYKALALPSCGNNYTNTLLKELLRMLLKGSNATGLWQQQYKENRSGLCSSVVSPETVGSLKALVESSNGLTVVSIKALIESSNGLHHHLNWRSSLILKLQSRCLLQSWHLKLQAPIVSLQFRSAHHFKLTPLRMQQTSRNRKC